MAVVRPAQGTLLTVPVRRLMLLTVALALRFGHLIPRTNCVYNVSHVIVAALCVVGHSRGIQVFFAG